MGCIVSPPWDIYVVWMFDRSPRGDTQVTCRPLAAVVFEHLMTTRFPLQPVVNSANAGGAPF